MVNHGFIDGLIYWVTEAEALTIDSLIVLIGWLTDSYWLTDLLHRWFIDSLVHWFVDSMTHRFTEPLNHSFIASLTRWFAASLIHWLIQSLHHWFHWFLDWGINWFMDSSIQWFIDLLTWVIGEWLTNGFVGSLNLRIIEWLVYWCSGSLIQSFVGSLIHWIVHSFHSYHLLLPVHFMSSRVSFFANFISSLSSLQTTPINIHKQSLRIVMSIFRNFRPGECRALLVFNG